MYFTKLVFLVFLVIVSFACLNVQAEQDPAYNIRYNEISLKFNCKVIDSPVGKRDIEYFDFNNNTIISRSWPSDYLVKS